MPVAALARTAARIESDRGIEIAAAAHHGSQEAAAPELKNAEPYDSIIPENA